MDSEQSFREIRDNPIEPYGKSRGGHTFDLYNKINVLKLKDRLRRVFWLMGSDNEMIFPNDVQYRRDKRWIHNRQRKAAEDYE